MPGLLELSILIKSKKEDTNPHFLPNIKPNKLAQFVCEKIAAIHEMFHVAFNERLSAQV